MIALHFRDKLNNSQTDKIHDLLLFGKDVKVFLDKLIKKNSLKFLYGLILYVVWKYSSFF